MALKSAEKKNAPAKTDLPKADGWLNNLMVADRAGNLHRLPKGYPLYVDNNVMASLINAEKTRYAEWEAAGSIGEYEPLQVTIVCTVSVPSDKAPEPIQF